MTPDPSEITPLRTIATLCFRVIAVCVTAYSMRPAQSAIHWLLTPSEYPFRPQVVYPILDLLTVVLFISLGVLLWLISPSLARRAVPPRDAADHKYDPAPEATAPARDRPSAEDRDTLLLRRIFLLAVRTFAVIAAATKVYDMAIMTLFWLSGSGFFNEAYLFSQALSLAVLAGVWHFAPTLAGLAVPDPPGKFSPQRVSLAFASGIVGLAITGAGLWLVANDRLVWLRIILIVAGVAMIASALPIARGRRPAP